LAHQHGIYLLEATSVAVDKDDNVYCFNRGNMPVLVFDIDGNLIRHWYYAPASRGQPPPPPCPHQHLRVKRFQGKRHPVRRHRHVHGPGKRRARGLDQPSSPTTRRSHPPQYGNKCARWRGTEFVRPHAIEIDHENNVWLIDDVANCITKCDTSGSRIMMLLPNGTTTLA
jgi:hypothetical protein